ncbi:phage recombination protein Bet [Thiohalocapsa halophila]|uniref:Phage recombination protein Bet n=1 Tax=Thiohalocapsa halophila TaxID=69359 RepID=A0ABS1CFI8_9GAMM|nr:phage recombination protein Bet [Thiohalocapsa halophila]MBK1630655.1 phage recombination protein Bet [Thiohalocapsa halophila]
MATRKDNETLPSVNTQARFPISQTALNELGLDANTWRVLTDSIFPSAKTADGIALAVRYCQARGLDVLKRPVHVVPMWSKAQGREIETVWPGINEVTITAARTGQYAGIDAPRLGPNITRTFSGRAKTDSGWRELSVQLTYPEWCEVTVYRLVNGQRCPFTEIVFWEETYSRAGGQNSEVPTAMWIKRPRGQLIKCAKAAALRAAFPEEGTYVAEEMEGKSIEPEEIPAKQEQPQPQVTTPQQPEPEQADAVDAEFKAKVAKLISRAQEASAWGQAQEYLRARCKDEQLKYALNELHKAAEAATAKAA